MYLTVLSSSVQAKAPVNQGFLSYQGDKCSHLGAQFPWGNQLSRKAEM